MAVGTSGDGKGFNHTDGLHTTSGLKQRWDGTTYMLDNYGDEHHAEVNNHAASGQREEDSGSDTQAEQVSPATSNESSAAKYSLLDTDGNGFSQDQEQAKS